MTHRPLTQQEDDSIREKYLAIGPCVLGRLLGRDHGVIRRRAIVLGVQIAEWKSRKAPRVRVGSGQDGRPELHVSEGGTVERLSPLAAEPCVYACGNVMQPNDMSGEWSRYGNRWICPECLPRWTRENQDKNWTCAHSPYGPRKEEQE